ncbi:hypothetical protein [Immundisolibacter cernigliae]|uniref:Uncharacterized protein n=1 Tax=Immundisolibacter cernigliae TaxID=1810504 RepID=A0A1B1YV19_9GAMM|nr:hypothetical protein [Immundisolibacter cernigliae]ANX04579.1 hypothetical protein PG2T_10625 [Immundisolibacter cernigliae]
MVSSTGSTTPAATEASNLNDDAFINDTASNNSANPAFQDILHRGVEGIVLIDGARLAGLMIDHEVGITSRTLRIPKIDSDHFEDEAV